MIILYQSDLGDVQSLRSQTFYNNFDGSET